MSALLLAAAGLLWPIRPRRSRPGPPGIAGVSERLSVTVSGSSGRRAAASALPKPVRVLALAVACCAVVGAFLVAGVAGLLAAALALGTAGLLGRQEIDERRRRKALIDIVAALRILGRELQAGADPGLAAANGATAAAGEGAVVLSALAHLTRTENLAVGTGLAVQIADDRAAGAVRDQVVARLRGGWLLTKWHGLAFFPLVAALIQDLSEQLAAGAERSGQVAGPRTSGYVMALLPMLGIALGAGMGADPLRVLTGSAVGNVLLLVGVSLTCAGLLWSARIVRA